MYRRYKTITVTLGFEIFIKHFFYVNVFSVLQYYMRKFL